ncbi:type II toxin-antitoxin system RelE/ParE family toxin [Maribrevibacterium harenarium]|uniref:Type II toxin-antitoxin system RelE/ParE family toxin n=1 Tax=Maribrevibacterium harenarium TaxID=2589817 RepID=A0A501WMB1_9GAMM|nr:type II toxin-antitoxin system RelE/ParE family toxin [Maribrevibacterium harenarium]TPE49324.1 type II toxin-antitoxin system RelE/ParE family toxin [Maribrevibacterium harenarium]
MAEIQWTEYAQNDLFDLMEYLQSKNPTAAAQLFALLQQRVTQLLDFPDMGRVGLVEMTRELVLTPSYLIVYQHHGADIAILRVLHTSRQWPLGE